MYVLLFLSLCVSCGKSSSDNESGLSVHPARIISLAPSVTEILYELGLDSQLVGVTQYCNYPPQAAQKEKVGAHTGANYEAILRLKPDLAVILKEQSDVMLFLDKYKIRYVTVGSESVAEIIESVRSVAAACGVGERGGSLARSLRLRVSEIASSSTNTDPPKVLLCVSRDNAGSGAVGKCFAAGASSFYNQLIESAGGVNVLKDTPQAYPAIGAEAVMRLDPDIIVDISSSYLVNGEQAAVCNDWRAFKSVSAVRTNNVRCLSGDYLAIPGPRFVLILEDLKTIFSEYAQTRN